MDIDQIRIKREIVETLACQQCIGRLSFVKNKLFCETCNLTYPISMGLVFMGYDAKKKNEIKKTILSEKKHQTNLEEFQKHYTFAYPSFKLGLLSIKILHQDIKVKNPIAIDVGSGGSPMGKILSYYGFDTYRCELDPNSLFSGLIWNHQDLTLGKHIVCDVSILPFPSNSIDVVYCKEFVHHIKDYYSFFLEINRILRKNGVFLMIEPTSRFGSFLKKDYHFGHHFNSIFHYYSTLLKAVLRLIRFIFISMDYLKN